MAGNVFRNYAVALTSPSAWIGIVLIVGIVLLWINRPRPAKWTLTLGALLYVIFSFDPVPEFLLNSFENYYPGLDTQKLQNKSQIKYVTVLAGGYIPHPSKLHPLTTELTQHTLIRLIEGIRIYRELPGTKLVLTGKGWAKKTEAQAMQEMAIKLGVPAEDIITENESTHTYAHTQYLKPILNKEPFILVTSAIHMPRAMGLFLKAGFNPIPAPAAHMLLGEYELFRMEVPFARGDNLEDIDFWFNEFSGIVLAKFKGRI